MTISKSIAFVVIAFVFIGLYPQQAFAESFKNSDFLELKENEKKYWILASIETIWQVQTHKNKVIAQCIADWYYKDVANKNGLLIGYAEKYPDHTPTTVLVTLLEKACGFSVK